MTRRYLVAIFPDPEARVIRDLIIDWPDDQTRTSVAANVEVVDFIELAKALGARSFLLLDRQELSVRYANAERLISRARMFSRPAELVIYTEEKGKKTEERTI